MTTTKYWATLPANQCAGELQQRIEDYAKFLLQTGKFALWRRSYIQYNQAMYRGGRVQYTGETMEYSTMSVNHYRNLVQHLLTMTTGSRPAFEPRATNSDVKSQAQTILARGLLDYYMREKRLERYLKQACEHALLYGEGFLTTLWDATSGEVYSVDPETGIEIREGDIQYTAYEPINVVRDVTLENASDAEWYIVRQFVNKWDLAAKYPELADRIITMAYDYDTRTTFKLYIKEMFGKDLIPMYTFFHDRTEALPDGRQVVFLDSDLVLTDQALPYTSMPVHRICGGEISGTPFGYSVGYDLLAMQEMADALYSTIITNQETFGVQNIAAPKGANISVTQLAGGLNYIEYDPQLGKPEPMSLLSTPAEVYAFVQQLERLMETISGVNSVARGNPESSLKSGAALALVQSMAVQFSMGLQQSYTQLLEDTGTSTIRLLRDYAAVPRIAMIAGKSNRGIMKEFTGDDLSLVNRVIVDSGNPITRTTAGKVELATMMIQAGVVNTADQLLQVIQTGNLEPLTEGKTAELLAIKAENEALSDGSQVPVMITDDHMLHILEHKAIVSDPAVRQDPQTVQIVTEHIMAHYTYLSDPSVAPLLAALGQQPLQTQATPADVNAAAMPSIPPVSANEMAAQNQPNLPNMPVNPATGERVAAPQGAAVQGSGPV